MACSGSGTVIELLLYFVDPSQTKGGENAFLGGKVRLRVRLSDDEMSRYSLFSEAIVKKANIREEAMQKGMGKDISVKLSRVVKDNHGTRSYSINNQDTFDIEKEFLASCALQVFVCKRLTAFTASVPVVRVEADSSTRTETLVQKPASSQKRARGNDDTPVAKLRRGELFVRTKEEMKQLDSMQAMGASLSNSKVLNEVNIECGRCLKVLSLPLDRRPEKRLEYFKTKHLAACKKRPTPDSCSAKTSRSQTTLQGWLKPRTSTEMVDDDLDAMDDNPVQESDDNLPMDVGGTSDSDVSSGQSQLHNSTSSDLDQDTGSSVETDIDNVTDYVVFPIAIEHADNVCIRLNELIAQGRIPKDRILYKFLNDVTSILVDPNHQYDRDVIEFFNTVQYLGGERTVNFIRGPMWHATGQGGTKDAACGLQMNLGGPSWTTRQKKAAGYTTESGVIKPWLASFLKLAASGKRQPLLENDTVFVTGICLGFDGTPIKPAIQFDEKQGLNVGLNVHVDLNFVEHNTDPCPEFLADNVISEADVTTATTADNSLSLPVAVRFLRKRGKTGENVVKQILSEVRTVQTCLACLQEARSSCSVVCEADVLHCTNSCASCLQDGKLCDDCAEIGHTSHSPTLRACVTCINKNKKCVRAAVLIVTSDCEQGNKSAMEQIVAQRKDGLLDTNVFLFSVLPDPVHVGKSLKAGFANWPILLEGQRSCLTRIRTLHEQKSDLKRLLPRRAVVNKDRMDVDSVLHLSDESVLTFLASMKPAVHTILPDRHKPFDTHKPGLFPHPVAISCSNLGKIHVLDFDPAKSTSRLLEIRQHVPVDVSVLGEYHNSRTVASCNKYVLVCEHDRALRFSPVHSAGLAVRKLRRPALLEELEARHLSTDGTVPVLRARLSDHLTRVKDAHKQKGTEMDAVCFTEDIQPSCFCFVTESVVVVAADKQRMFVSAEIRSDGVVFIGHCTLLCAYSESVHNISSMTSHKGAVYAVHSKGLVKVDLDTKAALFVLSNETEDCHICVAVASKGEGVVFCDSGREEVRMLLPDGGTALLARGFSQLMDVAVEMDTVFVCDSQAGRVQMIAGWDGTVSFLRQLGKLYAAFGVHLKGQKPSKYSLPECQEKINQVLQYLQATVRAVQEHIGTQRQLNGPDGTVSAKTLKSVELIFTELGHLQDILARINNSFKVDLETCLTLCVENIHATSHFKQQLPTLLDYVRNLSHTVREAIKRMASWSAFYFTSVRSSYYLVPVTAMNISDIPDMDPLKARRKLSKGQQRMMRDWASDHGRAVRQRTVRQQTTMFSTGTLPLNMYLRQEHVSSERIAFGTSQTISRHVCDPAVAEAVTQEAEVGDSLEDDDSQSAPTHDQSDYDTDSSDSDQSDVSDNDNDETGDSERPKCLDFMLGRVSQRGRQIRFRVPFD